MSGGGWLEVQRGDCDRGVAKAVKADDKAGGGGSGAVGAAAAIDYLALKPAQAAAHYGDTRAGAERAADKFHRAVARAEHKPQAFYLAVRHCGGARAA